MLFLCCQHWFFHQWPMTLFWRNKLLISKETEASPSCILAAKQLLKVETDKINWFHGLRAIFPFWVLAGHQILVFLRQIRTVSAKALLYAIVVEVDDCLHHGYWDILHPIHISFRNRLQILFQAFKWKFQRHHRVLLRYSSEAMIGISGSDRPWVCHYQMDVPINNDGW